MPQDQPLSPDRRHMMVGAAGLAALAPGDLFAASASPTGDQAPILKLALTLETPTKPEIVIAGSPRRRTIIPLDGGLVKGRVNGEIISGESWLETRADGNIDYVVRTLIKADNGQIIADQATGFIRMADKSGPLYTKTFHRFDAPEGPHFWLNLSSFVGHVVRVDGGRYVRIYELTNAA